MSLLTWNTRGFNVTALILNQPVQHFPAPLTNLTPDLMCLQEVGNGGWQGQIGQNVAAAWNPLVGTVGGYSALSNMTIGNDTYHGYVVPWQADAQGNQRCSLVILWRAALGNHATMPINGWHDGTATHRPVFWITPANGGRRIGCIHAPSGGNMIYINGAIAAIGAAAPVAGWILAGDINFAPNQLNGMPAGTGVLHSGGNTQQSGGNLDYLLHNGAAPFVHCASSGAYVGSSDHLQVRFS